MGNLGVKTKKNLEDAFAGESMARNKYTYFSSVAKKAGFNQIANIFLETAENEREHAKMWAKELGLIGETAENLLHAAEGEHFENAEMYVRMAAEAREEGHEEIAKKLLLVGAAEKAHEERYKKLLENIKTGKVFKKEEVKKWKCGNCGHIHTGAEAPEKCPVCDHEQAYFEILIENY